MVAFWVPAIQAITEEAMGQQEKLAYTYHETGIAAGVSAALVRKLVAAGKLERIRIGACSRIPRHAVLKLCGAQREQAEHPATK
jgi:hypothetical protein